MQARDEMRPAAIVVSRRAGNCLQTAIVRAKHNAGSRAEKNHDFLF